MRSPVDLGLQQRYHGVHINDVLPQSTPYPLCERRGGRPGLPVPNSPYGLCGRKATLTKKKEDVIQTESGYILTRLDRMGMSSVEVALLLVSSVTAAMM